MLLESPVITSRPLALSALPKLVENYSFVFAGCEPVLAYKGEGKIAVVAFYGHYYRVSVLVSDNSSDTYIDSAKSGPVYSLAKAVAFARFTLKGAYRDANSAR